MMKSLDETIQYIIQEGTKLRDKYVPDILMTIDYVCIFSQTDREFDFYNKETSKLGRIAEKTPTGDVYVLDEKYRDKYGTRLIKIRVIDKTRPQRGDVDFAVSDYNKYKPKLTKLPVNLIKREKYEMIELIDPNFDVILYFSNPPLSKVLKLR